MTTTIARRLDEGVTYDVLVVGGGITGAAVAYEAASRGFRVALVEKDDLGGATSAATGKLVHGGLRYLKSLEIGLVRESLAERRILSTIAPGLVTPIPIVLPNPGWVGRLGLAVYDALAFDRNRVSDEAHRIPSHRRLSRAELAEHGLEYVDDALLYHDCMMPSPERLTLAFVRSAVARGAHVMNHARVERLFVREGAVRGAVVDVDGARRVVEARTVVNATGPWARDFLLATPECASLAGPRPAVRSEGIYLVTRKLSDVMVLFVSEHGHFSFAPWRGHSLIGPTETPYRGEVEAWRLTRASVERFLAQINATSRLPRPLAFEDVVAAYGGLRPLAEAAGDDTYGASRASECVDHARSGVRGFVTATGGKYTTSRAFAVRVVNQLAATLGRGRAARTDLVPLDACGVGVFEDARARLAASHEGVASRTLEHLVRFYGTDAATVLEGASAHLLEPIDDDGEVLAQVAHAARHEAATTLLDALLRRTGIGTLGDPGEALVRRAATVMADVLDWSDERAEDEVRAVRRAFDAILLG